MLMHKIVLNTMSRFVISLKYKLLPAAEADAFAAWLNQEQHAFMNWTEIQRFLHRIQHPNFVINYLFLDTEFGNIKEYRKEFAQTSKPYFARLYGAGLVLYFEEPDEKGDLIKKIQQIWLPFGRFVAYLDREKLGEGENKDVKFGRYALQCLAEIMTQLLHDAKQIFFFQHAGLSYKTDIELPLKMFVRDKLIHDADNARVMIALRERVLQGNKAIDLNWMGKSLNIVFEEWREQNKEKLMSFLHENDYRKIRAKSLKLQDLYNIYDVLDEGMSINEVEIKLASYCLRDVHMLLWMCSFYFKYFYDEEENNKRTIDLHQISKTHLYDDIKKEVKLSAYPKFWKDFIEKQDLEHGDVMFECVDKAMSWCRTQAGSFEANPFVIDKIISLSIDTRASLQQQLDNVLEELSRVRAANFQLREELNRVLNLSEDEKRDRLRCADSEDAPVVKFVVGDVDCN